MGDPGYRRVIVKLSGEALAGPEGFGVHQPVVDRIAADLVACADLDIELGVVVGGGNIFRGVEVSARGGRIENTMIGIRFSRASAKAVASITFRLRSIASRWVKRS